MFVLNNLPVTARVQFFQSSHQTLLNHGGESRSGFLEIANPKIEIEKVRISL
jgi:hypothetical protein